MPEKTSVPKSKTPGTGRIKAPSTSALRVRTEPRNLSQCARRKLQYSKLPIRCPQQINKDVARSPKKMPKCPESPALLGLVVRGIDTPRCRKSFSLIDLSPAAIDSGIETFRSETSEKPGEKENGKINVSEAAGVICRSLMLNAWRRRREEIVGLNKNIEELSQQVKHLHIQIVVLRRLLDNENGRVTLLKSHLDETSLECDKLKKDKETIRKERQHYEKLFEERSISEKNAQNELESARDLLKSTEAQLSRDRDKLLKLRDEKKLLLEKISSIETSELELRSLVTLANEETRKYKEKLNFTTEEKTRLQEQLRFTEETKTSLLSRVVNLETQLSDRDAALRRIEAAYSLRMSELNELKMRFQQQSLEGGWSNRVLQIAGSVVRVPRAIFRSLSLLSNSGLTLMR